MSLAANLVNVGTTPGDHTGDRGQVPFQKYNAAVTELYADVAALTALIGAGVSLVFQQPAPLSVWLINHNLNRFPGVTVVDSTNRVCEGDVTYVDANNVSINFTAPFSGEAYLN